MSAYALHHGDCLDVMPALAPGSVDAVITDPPYGTTACKWDSVIPFAPMWEQIKRVLKPRGACVLFGSQPFTSALVMSNPGWFRYDWIWIKNRKSNPLNAKIMPMGGHESILVFGQAMPNYYSILGMRDRRRGGSTLTKTGVYGKSNKIGYKRPILTIAPDTAIYFACENGLHPTQKPLALLEYLVKTYTNEGDTVLDFAFGSGTTGAACGNLGRRFVGIENDAAYFALGRERIATAYAPLRAMQAAAQ